MKMECRRDYRDLLFDLGWKKTIDMGGPYFFLHAPEPLRVPDVAFRADGSDLDNALDAGFQPLIDACTLPLEQLPVLLAVGFRGWWSREVAASMVATSRLEGSL